MRVDGAEGKGPLRVPCPLCGKAQKVAVKRGVLPRERPVCRRQGPLDKFFSQLPFPLFFWVGYLLLAKAVDLKRFVHNVCTVPDAALFVKLPAGLLKLQCPDTYNRVSPLVGPGRFYINDNHRLCFADYAAYKLLDFQYRFMNFRKSSRVLFYPLAHSGREGGEKKEPYQNKQNSLQKRQRQTHHPEQEEKDTYRKYDDAFGVFYHYGCGVASGAG